MEKVTLHVEGMSCEHCVNAVTQAMKAIGVTDVGINLADKTVTLAYDSTTVSLEKIKQEIEDQGFDVE